MVEKVKLAISGLRIFLGWPDIDPMCCCLKNVLFNLRVKRKFVSIHMKTLEYFFHAFMLFLDSVNSGLNILPEEIRSAR